VSNKSLRNAKEPDFVRLSTRLLHDALCSRRCIAGERRGGWEGGRVGAAEPLEAVRTLLPVVGYRVASVCFVEVEEDAFALSKPKGFRLRTARKRCAGETVMRMIFMWRSVCVMNLLVVSQIMIIPGAHAQDIPNNMLAFFDQEACPEGWTRAEIPGRSLLDRGNYIGSRSDGVIESVVFAFGNKGGEVSHKMTIEEMPHHTHPTSASSPSGFIVTGISDGFRLTGSSF
jgi:hypothetical protein